MAKESEIEEVTDGALSLTKEILVPVVAGSRVEKEEVNKWHSSVIL